jgi:uncharacterized membrane protein
MLKIITLFLLVTIFLTGTMQAQTLSDLSKSKQMNLRQTIAKETEKLQQESAIIDAEKMEKSERQQQPPQKFWTKRNTLIVIGVTALIIGVVIIAAKYSKRCIRRSPAGCNFGDDINCECVEYTQ